MKIKILLLAVCFFSTLAYATAEKAEEVPCLTIRIVCESGGGTNLISCGSDEQIADDVKVVIEELCNN